MESRGDRLSSNASFVHLEYPRKEAAVNDLMDVGLKQYSFPPWKIFLEHANFIEGRAESESCLIFTFEPEHNFQLGIPKMVKECTMEYIDSNMKITDKSRLCGSTRAVLLDENCSLTACELHASCN